MSLIKHRERIDIALHCLEAAKIAFEPLETEKIDDLPEDVSEFKSSLDELVDRSYEMLDKYSDEWLVNTNPKLSMIR